MNTVDIIVIAVIVISGLLAFSRGFVREMLSVGSWVAAALVTLYAYPYTQPLARKWVESALGKGVTLVADISAAVVVFVVTLVIASLVSNVIAGRIHDTQFRALDRSLGLLFGIARGAVLLSLAFLLISWMAKPDELPGWVMAAKSRPFLATGAKMLVALAPRGLVDDTASKVEQMKGVTKDAVEADRAVKRLARPPTTADKPEERGGYSSEERRGLERVIEGTQ
jgi:membrane protein required for colicin V production